MSSFCIFAAVSVSLYVSFSLCNYLLYLNYYPCICLCLYLYLCIHVSPFFSDFRLSNCFSLSSFFISVCFVLSVYLYNHCLCSLYLRLTVSYIAYDKMGYLGSGFPGCLCLRSHRP